MFRNAQVKKTEELKPYDVIVHNGLKKTVQWVGPPLMVDAGIEVEFFQGFSRILARNTDTFTVLEPR